MRFSKFISCLIFLLAFSGCNSTPLMDGSDKFLENGKRATFKVVVYGDSGDRIATGSAFKLSDDVVTAVHVIADGERVEVYDFQGELVGTTDSIRHMDRLKDIAVVDVVADSYKGLDVSRTTVSEGDEVWAIGSPLGLDGSVSKGVISSFREDEVGKELQFTAPISSGSSGGPILNSEGDVIGMTIATFEEGQNLNFALSIEHILELTARPENLKKIASLTVEASADELDSGVQVLEGLAKAKTLEYGGKVAGRLEQGDFDIEGAFLDFYKFEGNAGDVVIVSILSEKQKVAGSLLAGSTLLSEGVQGIESKRAGGKNVIHTKLPYDDSYYLIVSAGRSGSESYSVGLDFEDIPYKDQWVVVSKSEDGDYFYIHKDVVDFDHGKKNVWTLNEKEGYGFIGDKQYNSMVVRFSVDCRKQKIKIISASYRLDGDFVHNVEMESYSHWKTVIPETNSYLMYRRVCH